MIFFIQSKATANGAELHLLLNDIDTNYEKVNYYKGKSNNKSTKKNSIKSLETIKSNILIDTDELNAHIAFAALCILQEKSGKNDSIIEYNTENTSGNNSKNSNITDNFYRVFESIDLMSDKVQISLQRRPPCRFEMHSVKSNISINSLLEKKLKNNSTATSSATSGTSEENSEVKGDSNGEMDSGTNSKMDASTGVSTDTGEACVSVQVVLDVGHNPAAMEALSKRIQEQFPNRGVRYVFLYLHT